jgi:DNA-directed RNA polymerase subunit RPC12/RpoP
VPGLDAWLDPPEDDEMTCGDCGGRVEWQGPLSALTHTKCLRCGAIGSQTKEEDSDPDPPDEADDEDRDAEQAEER